MQIHCYRTAKHRGNSTQSKPRAAGLKGGGQRPDPIHISHRGLFFFFQFFVLPGVLAERSGRALQLTKAGPQSASTGLDLGTRRILDLGARAAP